MREYYVLRLSEAPSNCRGDQRAPAEISAPTYCGLFCLQFAPNNSATWEVKFFSLIVFGHAMTLPTAALGAPRLHRNDYPAAIPPEGEHPGFFLRFAEPLVCFTRRFRRTRSFASLNCTISATLPFTSVSFSPAQIHRASLTDLWSK